MARSRFQLSTTQIETAVCLLVSMRKTRVFCARTGSSKRRDQLLLLWSGAATRRAGCAALRVGPKRPSQLWLSIFGLAAERRANRTFKVNLSWCFVLHNVTDCLLLLLCNCYATAAVVCEYVSTERCSPSALLFASRHKSVPADTSLATGR